MIEELNLPIPQFLRALGGRKGLYLSPRRREQQEEGKEPQTEIKLALLSGLVSRHLVSRYLCGLSKCGSEGICSRGGFERIFSKQEPESRLSS